MYYVYIISAPRRATCDETGTSMLHGDEPRHRGPRRVLRISASLFFSAVGFPDHFFAFRFFIFRSVDLSWYRIVWYPEKWYGISLIFGSTSSGFSVAAFWFTERRGESSSPRASATRIRTRFCENGLPNLPLWPDFFLSPTSISSRIRLKSVIAPAVARRPADQNVALPPVDVRFSVVGGDLADQWYFYHQKKRCLPLFGSPAPRALGSPGLAYR